METTLYCLSCRSSDKIYVGITTKSIHERWKWHKRDAKKLLRTKLHGAIMQYGPADFDVIRLHIYPTLEAAAEAEIYLIQILDLVSTGYNTSLGGDLSPTIGGHTPETRSKISLAHLGKKASPETKAAMRRAWETREHKCFHKPDTAAKISAAKKGKPLTDKQKTALSRLHARNTKATATPPVQLT